VRVLKFESDVERTWHIQDCQGQILALAFTEKCSKPLNLFHVCSEADRCSELISQKVFIKVFCKIQFPHESVNLFFTLVMIKDKLTDLWGH